MRMHASNSDDHTIRFLFDLSCLYSLLVNFCKVQFLSFGNGNANELFGLKYYFLVTYVTVYIPELGGKKKSFDKLGNL